jgi:hypothetical protein
VTLVTPAVGLVVGDRGAIHQHVGGGVAAAVGDEVGPGAVDGALIVRLGHARRQHGQIHHVAVDQRQVVDELAVDDQPVVASWESSIWLCALTSTVCDELEIFICRLAVAFY